MSDWVEVLAGGGAQRAVLVTVVAAKGSVPRGPGTRMVIAATAVHGTIGGGHLEYRAIDIARAMLADHGPRSLHRFPLGASLGQCCGGLVHLLFEPVGADPVWAELLALQQARIPAALVTPVRGSAGTPGLVVTTTSVSGSLGEPELDTEAIVAARRGLADGEPRLVHLGGGEGAECFVDILRPAGLDIVLFGAGHVGRAVVNALAGVPSRITWVDTRDDAFPRNVPPRVERIATDTPEALVAAAPPGAYFLVMTHSHALDEALAETILGRHDAAYFGLIGSRSKRRQFERRMAARGMPPARFAAMTCPIGVAGITGKEPEVIAIAVAAELLQVRSRRMLAQAVPEGRRA